MERTTNLQLKKPGLDDDALISDLNDNFDTLDTKIGPVGNTSLNDNIAKVQNGLAYIVGDTNTTGSTLAVGAFVYVKGHSSISEGLRKVTASISANGSITTNNTTACPEGGLNALISKMASPRVIEITKSTDFETNDTMCYAYGKLIIVRVWVYTSGTTTNGMTVCTGLPIPYSISGARNVALGNPASYYQVDSQGRLAIASNGNSTGLITGYFIYLENE